MNSLAHAFQDVIPDNKPILFVCIGTDRSTGDSLGPLVGDLLTAKGYTVFGTLENPVHAVNLKDYLRRIDEEYPDHFIVAVDSCLGQLANVGKIRVTKGSLHPGAGVGKKLPSVGDAYVYGVVNVAGFMEYFVLQNTRLFKVMSMAREIADSIDLAMYRRREMITCTHDL